MPHLDAAEHTCLAVEAPQRAQVPYQALAHGLQDFWRGFWERRRPRQYLCDGVLHHETLLGPLALGDVLHRAEYAAGPTRLVPHDIALTVDESHLAVGPDHAVLHIVAPATPQRLRLCLDHDLLIFGVEQFRPLGEVEELGLRLQPKDAVGFIRPGDGIRIGVALPVADMRDALGLFQFALAFAQVAKHQEAGQSILQPSADLLEEPLFLRCPGSRVRALAETEHVRLSALRVEGHDDPGLDAQFLRHLGRQGILRSRPEYHGAARRPHGSEQVGGLRVHRHVGADGEEAGKFRASTLHPHPVRDGLRIAGIGQPRSIALEDRQHGVEHIAHHLLEVVRSLDGAVHPIHALKEPEMGLVLLLCPLALDRDARKIGDLFDDTLLRWRRTARFAGVYREGSQYPAIRGEYRRRPTRSEPVW